jgi:Fur family transcriptional regulator, ferric uptake regulator
MAVSQNRKDHDERPLGQRQTGQRLAIENVMRSAAGPLSVREIHERGAEAHPTLGIATVYRTLRLLVDDGRISPVILSDGETRYEMAGLGHHHHFHCRICGEVFDLPGCPVTLQKTYQGGYQVESHELTLHGTCPTCVESGRAARAEVGSG